MKVTYFFRKRIVGFNSIEELFYNISKELAPRLDLEIREVELPRSDFSFFGIYQNLKWARNNRGTVNHITGHVNYIALVTGSHSILTVHDVRSMLYGGILHRTLIKALMFWLPALLVKKITVISEFSKQELVALIPFAKSKIQVIYNPVNSVLVYSDYNFNTSCPRILLLGTKPNKNLERSIEALRGIQCKAIIVGKLSKAQRQVLTISGLDYENHESVPYKTIVRLYVKSDLVLFPSTYEGFGMPIIEAQAIGRPVITSAIGAMKEVSAEGACLVDPFSVSSIKKGVERVIIDVNYRKSIIERGKWNVKRFNLQEIVNQYVTLYKEIYNT